MHYHAQLQWNFFKGLSFQKDFRLCTNLTSWECLAGFQCLVLQPPSKSDDFSVSFSFFLSLSFFLLHACSDLNCKGLSSLLGSLLEPQRTHQI
jgi:hypothetical protein